MRVFSSRLMAVCAALLAVVLLMLTSCAQIPRSGPVGKSTDESAGNPNNACHGSRRVTES